MAHTFSVIINPGYHLVVHIHRGARLFLHGMAWRRRPKIYYIPHMHGRAFFLVCELAVDRFGYLLWFPLLFNFLESILVIVGMPLFTRIVPTLCFLARNGHFLKLKTSGSLLRRLNVPLSLISIAPAFMFSSFDYLIPGAACSTSCMIHWEERIVMGSIG